MSPAATSCKPRVLFVDDEPAVLRAMARLMRGLRNDIESVFVENGTEALAHLAQSPFDVVVADIRMPKMDGAELLSEVQRRFPRVLRIVLSGHADIGAARRAISIAHHFLLKPCDATSVREVIIRAIGLRTLLEDRELLSLVSGMRDVPARPQTYTELSRLLAMPETTSRDIARLISRDGALSVAFLKIVNSTFSPPMQRALTLEAAVSYLGLTRLRAKIFAAAATTTLAARAERHGYDLALNETRALLCAHLAAALVHDRQTSDEAFAAGLLHNVGDLMLLAEGSEVHLHARAHAKQRGIASHAAERELGSVSHAHVGAYLLGQWGLPYSIIEAIARQHQPLATPHTALDVVDAVYVSALLVDHYVEHVPNALEVATEYLGRFRAALSLGELTSAAELWLQDRERASVHPAHDLDASQPRTEAKA
jgi:HD-like signal output (HDOD) protein/ActR/RegA family two-component response regulator